MKVCFILNPRSGRRNRQVGLRSLIGEFIAGHGIETDLAVTEGPGHATVLARQAVTAGCTRIVAIGGDGTVNEISQAVRNTPAALALVPVGSGNGLARHLGLPSSPAAALRLAVEPTARIIAIDTGQANGHPFFNVMGLGLDAEVGQGFNRCRRRGLPAYLGATLAAFARHRAESCLLQVGWERLRLDLLWAAVANSDQYGNGAVIAPGARTDDGYLDLLAVAPVGWLGAANLACRLFLGNFDRSPRVRRWRGASFVIERPAAGLIHTDGEPHFTGARVEISVSPASLRVAVPPALARS